MINQNLNNRNLAPVSRWPSIGAQLFIWSFAFDFKGEAGGSIIQAGFFSISCIGFLLVVMVGRSSVGKCYKLSPSLVFWCGLLLLIGISSSVFYSVPVEQLGRVLAQFVLFFFGIVIARCEISRGVAVTTLLWAAAYASLASLFFRAAYAILVLGISITEVRFHILSPGLPFLVGLGFYQVFLTDRVCIRSWAILLLTTAIVVISVTRTYIITYSFFLLLVAVCYIRFPSVFKLSLFLKRLLVFSCIGVSAILAAVIARPNVKEIWATRLFAHNMDGRLSGDLTWITRQAEWSGMRQAMAEVPLSYVFGKGLGAGYIWSGEELDELNATGMKFLEFSNEVWFTGHSMWKYAFFSTGSVGVFLYIILFLWPSYTFFIRLGVAEKGMTDYLSGGLLALFCLLSFLSQSYISNPIGERFACCLLGVLVSCVYHSIPIRKPIGVGR